MDHSIEIQRTAPDYVAYVPKGTEGDTGNEHFLVERMPGGGLFAVWTQSSFEGKPDQHVVFARSRDGGTTWTAPRTLAGPEPKKGVGMASWAFPLVSKSGRLYVLYFRHMGVNDLFTHTTGRLAGIYSDDKGKTWSSEGFVPVPRSIYDNPDKSVPPNCIVWQKPRRLSDGKYFAGLTRWVSPAVRPPNPLRQWWSEEAVVEFLRFENVDDDPEPRALKVKFLAQNEKALRAGLVGHPAMSCIQEPSVIELPDRRLFCVMRTTLGSPYWSVSADRGATWTRPEPLRQFDDGPVLPHPLSPCPIYPVNAENYVLFYHNHDGHFLGKTPSDTSDHRRPVCLARGQFRPGARQPVWFSDPWFFMDNGGVSILRSDLAMYASFTPAEDGIVLWYPERKYFLLGKKIRESAVMGLPIPA